MRIRKYILFLVSVIALASCQNEPTVTLDVRECASLPRGRASARACVLEGKGYVFAGREGGNRYKADLWEYNPQTDSWTDLGASPMKNRVNATIAAADGKIYAGLGYAGLGAYRDSTYLQDWWSYEPATAQWTRLADFPKNTTVAASPVVVEGVIYVLYGFGWGWTRDIWTYDIASDRWALTADNEKRAEAVGGGCGTMLNGTYYFGTGYRTYNETQWFAADIKTDKWTRCASIPGKGREVSACAASTNHIYLFGGRHFAGEMTGGEIFDTYMRYSPEKNKWEWCGVMPCGRAENQIAFSIDGKVYFGLGEDEKGQVINTMYCIEE